MLLSSQLSELQFFCDVVADIGNLFLQGGDFLCGGFFRAGNAAGDSYVLLPVHSSPTHSIDRIFLAQNLIAADAFCYFHRYNPSFRLFYDDIIQL